MLDRIPNRLPCDCWLESAHRPDAFGVYPQLEKTYPCASSPQALGSLARHMDVPARHLESKTPMTAVPPEGKTQSGWPVISDRIPENRPNRQARPPIMRSDGCVGNPQADLVKQAIDNGPLGPEDIWQHSIERSKCNPVLEVQKTTSTTRPARHSLTIAG